MYVNVSEGVPAQFSSPKARMFQKLGQLAGLAARTYVASRRATPPLADSRNPIHGLGKREESDCDCDQEKADLIARATR